MASNSNLSRSWVTAFYILVYLVTFGIRVWHPITRPIHWVDASDTFYDAILDEQDWAETYQYQHPGVTLMAFAGFTRRAYTMSEAAPNEFGTWYKHVVEWVSPRHTTGFGLNVSAANIGTAMIISVVLVACVWVLHKLGGWWLAVSSSVFFAFAPFILTHGRVVNLDGITPPFMLLSALLLLLYLEENKKRYLFVSGIVGGLALLTKITAIFLVPFTGLALGVYLFLDIYPQWNKHQEGRIKWVVGKVWSGLALPVLMWLVLSIVPFVFWPAMWVVPGETLNNIFSFILVQSGRPHPNPRFFLERAYTETSPGVLYYPISILFNVSFVSFTFAIVAIFFYTVWRRKTSLVLPQPVFWLLIAYIVFFDIQMSLGAKKDQRYMTAVLIVIEIISAVGLVQTGYLIIHALNSRWNSLKRYVLPALVGIVLVIHGIYLIVYFPDIGAHKNHLLGGNPVAVRVLQLGGQNEGILYAADYLNSLPNTEDLKVGMPFFAKTSTPQYIDKIERILLMRPTDLKGVDYIFYTAELFQRYEFTPEQVEATPQVTVLYDNVPYMILYANEAQPTTPPVIIRRGGTWLIVLAWGWTFALAGLVAWALRRQPEGAPSQA